MSREIIEKLQAHYGPDGFRLVIPLHQMSESGMEEFLEQFHLDSAEDDEVELDSDDYVQSDDESPQSDENKLSR